MRISLQTIGRTLLIAAVAWCGAPLLAPAADQASRAFDQAQAAIAKHDFDSALSKLDEAIRLAPKDPKYLAMRGVVWLRKGDYAKGAADLKAAAALNPGDAAVDFKPSRETVLSAEAIRHGRAQVAAMLRDRPPMAKYDDAKFLRDWAERKFAGEDFGDVIEWDPTPPLHSDAEHLAPGEGKNAAILVMGEYTHGPKAGQPRSFEELWAGAVFELYNVSFANEFLRLNKEAEEGKVSKEAFVAGILKYELMAAQRTRAFYLHVLLPWMEKKKLPTNPGLWFCDWWASPETVLKQFVNKSDYPWRPYARVHDWATVHWLWRGGKYQKALKLLEQMQAEEEYEEELYDVLYWSGRCLIRLNKPKDALSSLNESIELSPHNAAAYRARAKAYDALGEKTKAEADRAAAKKMDSEE